MRKLSGILRVDGNARCSVVATVNPLAGKHLPPVPPRNLDHNRGFEVVAAIAVLAGNEDRVRRIVIRCQLSASIFCSTLEYPLSRSLQT